MRKTILYTIILSIITSCGALQAQASSFSEPDNAFNTAPARAEAQKFNIQFCGNEVGGWQGYFPDECQSVTAYLYIPAEQATKLAGNKITGLTLSVVTGAEESTTAKGTVFVSEDITQEPICQVNMTYKNAYFLEGYKQQAQFPRSKQYEIKENTPFYFGYTVNFGENNPYLLIGFDKLLSNSDYSGTIVATKEDGSTDTFEGKEIFKGQDNEYHNLYRFNNEVQ